jgi:hypothetical protein
MSAAARTVTNRGPSTRLSGRHALDDEAPRRRRQCRGDQVARALGADAGVARVSGGELCLVAQNARQVGELVHDHVGSHRHDGAFERFRIEHVDDHRLDAGGFKLARNVGRARHAGDVMARLAQQRRQPPSDRAARSGKKNSHAHAFSYERPGGV